MHVAHGFLAQYAARHLRQRKQLPFSQINIFFFSLQAKAKHLHWRETEKAKSSWRAKVDEWKLTFEYFMQYISMHVRLDESSLCM
jgi:hypothetical protein